MRYDVIHTAVETFFLKFRAKNNDVGIIIDEAHRKILWKLTEFEFSEYLRIRNEKMESIKEQFSKENN